MRHKPPPSRGPRSRAAPPTNSSTALPAEMLLHKPGVAKSGGDGAPLPIRQFLPESHNESKPKVAALAGAAGAFFVHPAHCCVYCGHDVYIPPRAQTIRCPMCAHELPVEDVLLSGTVNERQVVTCGKILVVENAVVTGNLIACIIDVAGEVVGDLVASHLCTLHATARHRGRLISRHLNLEPGAEVCSRIELIRE